VRNLDEILAVEGLDAIISGPVDLATTMGLYGDFERPEVQEAIETVYQKALEAGMPFGDGRPAEDPLPWLERGAQLIAIGDDEWFVRRSAYAAMQSFQDAMALHG
jgi:2-keto-3-deoxy-L-rhamnonate aldolase RhmA